jgi:hypothetical protein
MRGLPSIFLASLIFAQCVKTSRAHYVIASSTTLQWTLGRMLVKTHCWLFSQPFPRLQSLIALIIFRYCDYQVLSLVQNVIQQKKKWEKRKRRKENDGQLLCLQQILHSAMHVWNRVGFYLREAPAQAAARAPNFQIVTSVHVNAIEWCYIVW